jgi:REP element-mobilizing transposase RayT
VSGAPRGDLPAGIYHVTARTAGPIALFHDDFDRTYYCRLLAQLERKFGVATRMFCLMTTHVHLLLETRAENRLQSTMKWLNWSCAWTFNRQRGRTGHLFGRRYWSKQITTSGQLVGTTRYIARNPVRAKLCSNAEDWLWSSFAGTTGVAEPFAFVDDRPILAEFGHDRRTAIAELRAFVGAI